MGGRARPENGADSVEGWQPVPWKVWMCDRFDEDERWVANIPSAIGQHDAINQAREMFPGGSPLMAAAVKEEAA